MSQMLIGLQKNTKPFAKIPHICNQMDCVQVDEIQDHCYPPQVLMNSEKPL